MQTFNFKLVHSVVLIIIIKIKKDSVCHNKAIFIMYRGNFFTIYFDPQGPSSRNTYFKINKNSSWVLSGFYINENSSSQLVGLYWRVTGVCIVDCVESGRDNIFFSVSWFRASYINKWKHQLDTTILSVYFTAIVHSTCFGCYMHPSSGASNMYNQVWYNLITV